MSKKEKKLNDAEKFEDLIFKNYGQEQDYEIIKHNLLNIRETMLRNHDFFDILSPFQQLCCCGTIAVIVLHSRMDYMSKNMPISKPKGKRFEYSIDRDICEEQTARILLKIN